MKKLLTNVNFQNIFYKFFSTLFHVETITEVYWSKTLSIMNTNNSDSIVCGQLGINFQLIQILWFALLLLCFIEVIWTLYILHSHSAFLKNKKLFLFSTNCLQFLGYFSFFIIKVS